eukprot:TRINITY_DN28972_c0_g3_i1.p1 TRINITY_DN28972_c0_g3~~TRINITY_DN28972_c0_g3_i1.p1  ORF type:complete len:213 (-),score=25.21 TRINITY_DN28972_c0_g3_i1:259-897(-)
MTRAFIWTVIVLLVQRSVAGAYVGEMQNPPQLAPATTASNGTSTSEKTALRQSLNMETRPKFASLFVGLPEVVQGLHIGWPHWFIFASNFWKCGLYWLLSLPIGGIAGLLAITVFFILLALVGFGAGGVIAGSLAACCQARMGAVAAGSCFAGAQSVAANGIGATCNAPVLLNAAIAGALIAVVLMFKYHDVWFADTCSSDAWKWWEHVAAS